ncbi:hypothetical protein A3860_29955 [Niastella vici]|uniref:Insecticide toxin TcdB middle/N-terminal domain-containing protein n=1 Tax=Niastella vici TaxID=1703345 RepID=A0A1V9FUA8_9BACT|nr:SpvB/TcaC N-terminal domain-containing protein [Niastella vici]OQP61922.1 hypothetical protein A3860_29955 [Niastella vici]
MIKNTTLLLYCTGVLSTAVYIHKEWPGSSREPVNTRNLQQHKDSSTRVHSSFVQQSMRTGHTGDPVNDLIQLPEQPQTQGYAPSSIKDFEAADPATGISLMSVPVANSLGNAVLSFPMNLPEGRGGMEPDISITYNNEGGTTWMGTGWNLLSPAISIDTRWGVPRYDTGLETEMYMLNGEQMAPVNNRDTLMPRVADKRFYERVEGNFNKIIRHGNSPANYWWEVDEKNGNRHYYGGKNGVINSAVLKDDKGNIAYWALTESRDLNGNFISYEYQTVQNAGVAGSNVMGRQLYLSRILYTGNGTTTPPYKLDFISDRSLGEPQRKDVTIDARLGFKMVSADLLRKVNVSFNNQLIRTYDFSYAEGAFYKTILKSIKEIDDSNKVFYNQEFDYYDDARINNSATNYKSKDTARSWQVQGDGLKGDIQNPIPQFTDEASVISTAKVTSKTGGVVVTVGGILDDSWSKKMSVGGGPVFGKDDQEEITSLIDINGDGLPDKVFKAGGQLWYRANLGVATHSFGGKRPITGANDFGTSTTDNVGGGVQALPWAGFFGYNYTKSTTTSKVYFADFNGDGLIDIANDGMVYFNHLNAITGDPEFAPNSRLTPSPVFPGILDPSFMQKDTARQAKQERDFPLQDIIRFWEAPVSGTITITAPVQLQNVPNTTGAVNNKKDGVRASIQQGGTVLWSTTIGPTDFTVKTPANVSGLTVTKGQRIYFRLQSVYNGEDDLVSWDPVIQYTTPVVPQSDVQHKISNYYQASADFILHSISGSGMGKAGTIVIDGNFTKQVTADSVFLQVTRTRNKVTTSFFQQGFSGNAVFNGGVPVPGQFAVDTGDVLNFSLVSRSYIDRSAMQWTPHYAYIIINDGTPVTTSTGAPTMQGYPIPNNANFNNWLITAPPVTVAQQDTVILWPQVSGGGNGTLWFTVKGNDTVYARRRIYITGGTMSTAMDSIHLVRKAGEPLFMEYATDTMDFAVTLAPPTVQVYRDSLYVDSTGAPKDTIVLTGALPANLYTNPAQEYLGPLFRGWGAFGFKGDKGNGPLDETKLNLNEFNNYPTDPSVFYDSATMSQIPDPSKADFITLYPDLPKQSWMGYDTSVYITGGTMSSSRLYMHDVMVDTLAAGATAVYKISTTETNSYSLGVSAGPFSPSAGKSDATTVINTDVLDMNGDRYPDVLNTSITSIFNNSPGPNIQYTLPHGGLGNLTLSQPGGFSYSTGYQEGLGLGGEFEKAFTGNKTTKAASGAQNSAKASMGVSGSINWNEDNTGSTWADINGDGLPDRVFDDGNVMLNLGYRLAAREQWGLQSIDHAKNLAYGAGLGVNINGGSFEGGFGISRTDGRNSFILNDINGDGLPDQMILNGNDVLIRFNTGNGFGPAIPWNGFNDIASLFSVGESYNLAITVTIPIYIFFIKICINPSGSFGHGTSRQEKAFMDLDGDGYADYVESKNDGQLSASSSAIGRTNMLRTVKSPIAHGSFTLDYERVGNTYAMPQSKWVLKNVTVFDGVPGDGIDTMRRQFKYIEGYQDRYEREFYGFSKVITSELNTAGNNAVYRNHVQQYFNSSYYNKGLLASEYIEDAAGHKYTQTNYTYDIRPTVKDTSVRFPALITTEKVFYEGGATANAHTAVHYEYDTVGNITRITDEGDGSNQDLRITNIAYHSNNSVYLKSIPSDIEITTVEGVKRKRTTTLNTSNAIAGISEVLADGTVATTSLEYDGYGNITQLTQPANYKNQRMSYTFEYDNVVHNYPVKITDAFGYITTNEYDYRFGTVTRTVSRNNEETKYALDNRGRIIRFTGPYELAAGKPYTIAVEYHTADTVPYTITRHYDPEYNDDINLYNFADGLGRSVQLKKQVSLFKGKGVADEVTMVVSGTSAFDAFGRVIEQYYPLTEAIGALNPLLNYASGKFHYRDVYDAEDRLVKRVLADSSAMTIAYTLAGSMISRTGTDALGNKKETGFDVRGRKRFQKAYAAAGPITTRYEYDALNEMVKVVDDKGNALQATYDNMGRRTSVTHPDAGLTTFEYDAAGNLLKKVTAQIRQQIATNGAIQYQYDYDRLTGIDYPRNYQNKVKYTYGAPGTGTKAGRLILQEDASGGQEFFYSMQGQVVKTIRTVLTSPLFCTTYISEQEYDSWNRLKKMVYPDGETMLYHYNKSGALSSMDGIKIGSAYQFVNQVGYNEFDERVYMRYSNGTENVYRYEDKRRLLTQLQALSPTGQAMMNNAYTYDATGRVLGIINNVQPSAGTLGGSAKQSYQFDALNRLEAATGEFSGPGGSTKYGLTLAYDNLNNIVHKTMTGATSESGYDHAYSYGGRAPYQATQIGSNTYKYDLNGNQLGYGDIENAYDEENRLVRVINKGVMSQYTYDADDNRAVKSSGGVQGITVNGAPAGAVTHADNYTVYVSPYMAAQKATFTKHYYIDGQRVASKLGHGTFTNISFPQTGLTAGGIDYTKRAALIEKARNDYYASLGVSPGPPTDKNFYARPENSGIAAPVYIDTTSPNVPTGWPGNTTAPPNGPPVYVSGIPSRDSVKAGYGFEDAGQLYEGSIYFYHFDNVGSTAYVTNFAGQVIQHMEYAPSGETIVSEHAGSFQTAYLFNGKGYDEETGYYFYGPQYYDPALSQWLNVTDPSGEGSLDEATMAYSVVDNDEDDADELVANPVVSKISYSGSAATESQWPENKAEGDKSAKKKEQTRRVYNKPRRKVLANRYGNLDYRFNKYGPAKGSAESPFRDVAHDVSDYEGPVRDLDDVVTIHGRERSNSVVHQHGFQRQRSISQVTIHVRELQRVNSNSMVRLHAASAVRRNSLSVSSVRRTISGRR